MYQKISEQTIDKSNPDINAFIINLSEFHVLKMHNINQDLVLYLDNKPIFKTKYKKKIHKLVAIGFAFTGCGTIDWYKITDLKSGVMKGESFVK